MNQSSCDNRQYSVDGHTIVDGQFQTTGPCHPFINKAHYNQVGKNSRLPQKKEKWQNQHEAIFSVLFIIYHKQEMITPSRTRQFKEIVEQCATSIHELILQRRQLFRVAPPTNTRMTPRRSSSLYAKEKKRLL